jgi:DNA-binding transcriptional MerR regulator
MSTQLTIGDVSKRTGLSTKTIRFYEDEGCIPHVSRSESGYRLYTEGDVWRLRLVRQIRMLGLPLAEIKPLIGQSMETECTVFADDLGSMLARQKLEIDRRIAELESLREQINVLEGHVEHCECEPGQTVADCYCCSLLDEEGGDPT